jgi:hypothetical protein
LGDDGALQLWKAHFHFCNYHARLGARALSEAVATALAQDPNWRGATLSSRANEETNV